MREQLMNRLKELKTELASGQKRMADLDAQRASLRETMLRISGAIQVLEEELANNNNGEFAHAGKTLPNPVGIASE